MKEPEKIDTLRSGKHSYRVKEFNVFWKIKHPGHSNHLKERRTSSNAFVLKPVEEVNHQKDETRMLKQWKYEATYPQSLWTARGIYEITSPREGGCPSRHHKLVVKNRLMSVKCYTCVLIAERGNGFLIWLRVSLQYKLHHSPNMDLIPIQQKPKYMHTTRLSFYLPHILCSRSVKPCWGCKQSWPCLDGTACGWTSGVAQCTQRRRRRPVV